MRWYNKGWIIKDEAVVCVSRINETVVIWEGSSVKYGVCWWGGCPRGGPPSPPHPSIYSILHVGEKSQRCIVLTSSLATDTHLLKYWYEEENECLEYNLNIWMFYVREQQLIDKKKKKKHTKMWIWKWFAHWRAHLVKMWNNILFNAGLWNVPSFALLLSLQKYKYFYN